MSPSKAIAEFRIPMSAPSRVVARSLLSFLHFAGRFVCRVPIRRSGFDRINEMPQSIVVSNHHSLVDTPCLFMSIPGSRRNRTATVGGLDFFKAEAGQPWFERLFRVAVIWFIRSAMNVMLIDRVGGEYSELDRIDAMIAAGWSLVIFPEATRSRDGRLGRFRHGAAELARRNDLPVIPVRIEGTERILPPGVWWPRSAPLRMIAGEPMRAAADESAAAFSKRLAAAIEGLSTSSESREAVAAEELAPERVA
jgi:1-acyl-sn-glycerol-3-phosphate acyltransferase